MAIHELKEQIARLPEQPGVYLYFNADGDTIYVGKARALRDRVRNYLGAYGVDPKTDALLDEVVAARGHRHRLGGRGARAREQPDQAARARNTTSCCATTRTIPYLQLTTNEAFPRVLVARARRARRQLLRRPVPAGAFRAQDDVADAPAVRDPVVQRGDHRQARPAVPRVRHQALHRAVRRHDLLARRSTAAPSSMTQLFLEGTQRRARQDAARRGCSSGRRARAVRRGGAAARRDADGADARTIASRRWRPPSSGTATCSASSSGPAGVVVQVFQVRSGRVVERIELGTEDAIVGVERGRRCWRRRSQQFYELRGAPPEVHVPAEPDEREALEAWLSERAGRRVRIVVPQRGEKRGLVDLAQPQRRARLPDALQPDDGGAVRRARDAAARARAAGAAAPDRVLRHLDDPGQRDGRVDGGVRRRPDAAGEYRKFGSGACELAARSARASASDSSASLRAPVAVRDDDFAAMHEVVLRRYRKLLEQGGPFPDLIADRRRQGTAVGGVRGARGARAREPRRGRHREERRAALHARPRGSDRAGRARSGAAADPADPRRGAPVRRHVPPPRARRCATCARSSTTCRASGRAGAGRC